MVLVLMLILVLVRWVGARLPSISIFHLLSLFSRSLARSLSLSHTSAGLHLGSAIRALCIASITVSVNVVEPLRLPSPGLSAAPLLFGLSPLLGGDDAPPPYTPSAPTTGLSFRV